MMMSVDHIRFTVGIIGNVLSFLLFASPAQTFIRIIREKSVEEFHPYLYLATLMNCMAWIYYGMPFVHPHSILVVTIKSFGLFLQLCYLSIFFFYTGKKYRLQIVATLFVEIMVMAAIIAATLATMQGLHAYIGRSTFVGVIATLIDLCMYESPVSIMLKVIETKSAEYLPKMLSVAWFLNGICWSIYALLRFDFYILIANGVGALLAFVQLILIVIYRNPPPKEESILELV